MSNFISHKGFHWEYETYGTGTEALFAFHGFGNHCSDFKILEPSLGKKYKIVAFNLPYHGKSFFDDNISDKSISKNDLKELIHQYIREHDIKRFSLMGYSLGGKIALQLIELFPAEINTVFLFAPDGIRNSWSNGFVTRNKIGKKIYSRIIQNPSRFLRFVKMLKDMNLVHEKFSDFIHNSLDTREKRQQVWDVWICLRDIKPKISSIRNLVNEYNISVELFFGKYDHVIPPAVGKYFIAGLKNKNGLHVVEMGHIMLREKMNEYLAGSLNK
jgi:pimeloyl-ACP methyl ester carboxylesterase